MSEVKIYADLKSYEPRTFMGHMTGRTALTIAAAAAIGVPTTIALNAIGLPSELTSIVVVLVAAPIGAVGCGRIRGLKFEQFMPILLRSWATPRSSHWTSRRWVEPDRQGQSKKPNARRQRCRRPEAPPPELVDVDEFDNVAAQVRSDASVMACSMLDDLD
ncbi:MAG: PrgI family protein [Collinsella sp.]|nr:PrgI family protein [Collinsella sp.]